MKHFGTDIIRGIDLYQSEGARQFCFPSHTVLSLLRGEMRVRAGEKNFSFAGSGIILIPSGRKTDLFCEQSAVFLLIRISPAFLMEAFTRDRLLTEVISSHELPELLTLVPDLAALVPLFLESAELNRLAVNRLLFTFLERLDHTLGADAPSPDQTRLLRTVRYPRCSLARRLLIPISPRILKNSSVFRRQPLPAD